MEQMNYLENKSVVVTGGASGMGFAIATELANRGAKVAVGSRRSSVVEEAIRIGAGRLRGKILDVADRASVQQFFDWVVESQGPVDILINAAGVNIKDRSISAMTPEMWDQVMAINATGAYNCIYAVLPSMRERKEGFIINISSIAGKRAIALGGVAYSASKFAMTSLGTCLSNELAEEGIRVTNIYPGEVDTPILEQRPVPVTEEHRSRILKPADVAEVIVSIANTPSQVHVPELVIKPLLQQYY